MATERNRDLLVTEGNGDTVATRSEEDMLVGLDTRDMEVINESEEGPALSCGQDGIFS